MRFIKTKDVKSPERAHVEDSGIDFFIPNWWQHILLPNKRATIQLWIKIVLPKWCDLQFVDKSWLASKSWITIMGGLIDNWYTWELAVVVYNTNEDPFILEGWMKIVQGVIREVNSVFPEEMDEDEWYCETSSNVGWRWEWGFGSTNL